MQARHETMPLLQTALPRTLPVVPEVDAALRGLLALACFVSLVLLAACGRGASTIEVELTQEQIQSRVMLKFPVERKLLATDVRLEDPVVRLRAEHDDIAVKVNVKVQPPIGRLRTGHLAFAGKLRYRPDETAFYLDDLGIEELQVDGLSQEAQARLRALVQPVAATALAMVPVYTFRGRNVRELTAEHVLDAVFVRDGKLVAQLKMPL
ncbi:MAG: hypothetical protein JWN48_3341 [Myxococcaceae bacterium]|nr:hypothetical protein [Myxococcaceae bacterium]